ncbi:MAG: hypothetical protein U9M98_03225 [Patescibacteria group bacterium]|nr:hypothetical protein [Patescibacteria group bacterium]
MRKIKRSKRKSIGLDALEKEQAQLVQIVGYLGATWIISVDGGPPVNDRTGKEVSNFEPVTGDYYFMLNGVLWCSARPYDKPT